MGGGNGHARWGAGNSDVHGGEETVMRMGRENGSCASKKGKALKSSAKT